MHALSKVATHIKGLDEILFGGFPEGRTTLINGGPGTGKSVIALEFLYRGALAGEPGIFVTFEERVAAMRSNALTLGWDLEPLEKSGKLFILEARVDPEAIISGTFNMRGLLAIVGGKATAMGARRVVFDALDALMRLFDDPARERNEIYALHEWLTDRGMTAILTVKATKDNTILPRYEFLEFMADCVITVTKLPSEHVSTRELQVIKYRGSDFGGNAYPFVSAEGGIRLIPISTFDLQHKPLGQYVTSGNAELDKMLGGGYRQGSSVLITGTSGTGKTTLVNTFVHAACGRGEKVLFLGYEESAEAMVTSMLSPGIDLRPDVESGKMKILTVMPEAMSTEQHLVRTFEAIEHFQPEHVIVDAISSFQRMGSQRAAFEFAMRLVSTCKDHGITVLMVNQSAGMQNAQEISGLGISSIIDTVIFLRFLESDGELNRVLLIMKSRGTKHSNQYREYRITDRGIEVTMPSTGEGGVLTGIARAEQEAEEERVERRRNLEIRQKEYEINLKRAEVESEMARLRASLELAESELAGLRDEEKIREHDKIERKKRREEGGGENKRGRAGGKKNSPLRELA